MDARLSAAKAINKRASSIRIASEITWSRVISFRARVSVLHRKAPVESKIQAKYVHAWFAKKPEVRTVCVVGDYLLRLLDRDAASFGDAQRLGPRRIGGDVGVKT
jgi:hypothetical protein